MLQQTQAARVVDFYAAWLKRFPTWEALANAKTPELLHAWAGLGYNRRALYLRDAARQVTEQGVPKTEEDWRMLKGVGPYTAAAVYAFASKRPSTAVDTNIRRVIGRFALGILYPVLQDDPKIVSVLKKLFTHPGDWMALHALMDIGATICLPRVPLCEICPLRSFCKATSEFSASTPVARTLKKKPVESIHEGKKFPDRIYRGKILKLIRERNSVRVHDVGTMVDPTFNPSADQDWIIRIIERMKRDGFIDERKGKLFLPRS